MYQLLKSEMIHRWHWRPDRQIGGHGAHVEYSSRTKNIGTMDRGGNRDGARGFHIHTADETCKA